MAAATKKRLDPNQVYRCCVAYVSGPMAAAALEGQELLGGDERIVALGDHWDRYWVPLGTPESEWPTEMDRAVEFNEANARSLEEERKAAFERRAKANAVKFEPPQLVKAKRDIVGDLDGQPATVKRGSVMPVDHPFVLEHEDCFA